MYLSPRYLLTILFAVAVVKLPAQLSIAYNINAIGNAGSQVPVFSGPFAISGEACFMLSNGIRVMQERQSGFFSGSCIEKRPQLSVISTYPNPVISNLIVKANAETTAFTEPVIIILRDFSGKKLAQYTTDRATLLAGYQVRLPVMAAGVCTLQVSLGSTGTETVRIIKATL